MKQEPIDNISRAHILAVEREPKKRKKDIKQEPTDAPARNVEMANASSSSNGVNVNTTVTKDLEAG